MDSSCQICEQVISPTEPSCQLRRLIFLRVDDKINVGLFVKSKIKVEGVVLQIPFSPTTMLILLSAYHFSETQKSVLLVYHSFC